MIAAARAMSPLGKVPDAYYLSSSVTLPGAIRGLFTKQPRVAGELLGEYRGRKITEAESLVKSRCTHYMFEVQNSFSETVAFVVDGGVAAQSSFARYVNAPNTEDGANAVFLQIDDAILLFALHDIPANTELLAWYGDGTPDIIKAGSNSASSRPHAHH